MPTRPARFVVPFALLIALLVVGLNTWFAVSSVQALLQSERWLAHTWEVIGQNQRLLTTAITAESSARGFVLTGRPQSLSDSRHAIAELPTEVQRFEDLTRDNPVQTQNVREIRDILERRRQLLEQLTELRAAQGAQAATDFAATGLGAAEMDRLRGAIGRMDVEERRLLTDRAREAKHNGYLALFAIALACVLDLLMIAVVTFYFVEERRQRVESERTAERLALATAEATRSAEEVHRLNADLENRVRERTAELEATNRELEAFSYSVSHDLRAPLRTIDGFSLALEEDYAEAVDETGRDYIRRVRTGVQRMGQLIDALLQLSRITRADVVRESIDVARLAASVASTLEEQNSDRQIEFVIEPGPLQEADPKLVQVALENLMGNAVKFTARREQARVYVGWDGAVNAWLVRDNGAGFDMQYSHKLFNAFNRLHGDKDFKGSGIGLATVARVVRRHGGRIWADSTVDHGASFWFTLG